MVHESRLKELTFDPNLELSLELKDGRSLQLEEFRTAEEYATSPFFLSHILQISGWTVPIPIIRHLLNCDSSYARWETGIDQEDGSYLLWDFRATTNQDLTGQQCTGICLGVHEETQFVDNGPLVMIVGDFGNGMERVGLDWIYNLNYRWYSPTGKARYDKEDPESRSEIPKRHPVLQRKWQEILLV